MPTGVVVSAARFVTFDVLGDAIRFPVWWYTRGFAICMAWLWQHMRAYWRLLAIDVWIRNLFVPMFGQHDVQGRIISFCFRLVHIVARSVALVAVSAGLVVCAVAWLLLPVCLAILFFFQSRAMIASAYVG